MDSEEEEENLCFRNLSAKIHWWFLTFEDFLTMFAIHHLFQVSACLVLLVQLVIPKAHIEKGSSSNETSVWLFLLFHNILVYLDKLCGNDHFILDGDNKPGIILYLTSSSKYKPNTTCTVKFRTAQISQRFVVTVEKMEIKDCPGDQLIIYDGPTVLNSDDKQKCGSAAPFTFTVRMNEGSESLLSLEHL